jgi:hypothetical protein
MRAANLLLLTSMILFCVGCTVWREHSVVNTWSQATGGEGFERSFWKEVKDKNWKELDKHIAANYVLVTPAGRLDRAAALRRWTTYEVDDYTLSDFQVELNAQTLVVTYTAMLRGKVGEHALPSRPIRMMSVWQQQKKGWVAIAQTETGET